MAKISELANGGIILETDELVALRAGGNVRVKVDGLATQDASSVSITGGSITGLSALSTTGSVGIGTTPTSALDVRGESLFGSGTDGVKLTYSASNSTGIIDTGFTSTGLEFRTGNIARIRIDPTGNLLVNRSSTSGLGKLNVEGGADFTGGDVYLCRDLGKVGIGCSPSVPLEVNVTGAGDIFRLTRDTGTNGELNIDFDGGITNFNSEQGGYTFTTSSADKAVSIGSTGSLLIGRTTENSTDSGHRFSGSGFAAHIVANDYPLLLNRLSSDGALLTLRKDSVTVGTVGSITGTGLAIESGDGALYLGGNRAGGIRAVNNLGSSTPRLEVVTDATTDLGAVTHRFRHLYLSGSASIGKTGSSGVLLLNRSSDGGAAGALSLSGDDFVMNTGYATGDLVFKNGAVEAMRIDGGNLSIGRTSASAVNQNGVTIYNTGDIYSFIDGTTSTASMRFYRNTAGTPVVVGSITTNGTTTAYNTSSDQRLKENIADADDAGVKIDSIQVRKYDWKADGSHQDYGMIAQELQVVAPEAVSGDPDSDEMMAVDYSKLVPMMLKEIQSLRARINTLEGN